MVNLQTVGLVEVQSCDVTDSGFKLYSTVPAAGGLANQGGALVFCQLSRNLPGEASDE
jgi:hypothetical protein